MADTALGRALAAARQVIRSAHDVQARNDRTSAQHLAGQATQTESQLPLKLVPASRPSVDGHEPVLCVQQPAFGGGGPLL